MFVFFKKAVDSKPCPHWLGTTRAPHRQERRLGVLQQRVAVASGVGLPYVCSAANLRLGDEIRIAYECSNSIGLLLLEDCLNNSNVETFLFGFRAVHVSLLADRSGEGNCVAELVLHSAMQYNRTSGVCQFLTKRPWRELFTGLFAMGISLVCFLRLLTVPPNRDLRYEDSPRSSVRAQVKHVGIAHLP